MDISVEAEPGMVGGAEGEQGGTANPTMMLAMKLRLGEVVKAKMHVFGCAGQTAR